jgi:hypothetical protein
MNATQDRPQGSSIRASDADRDAVLTALSEHFQAGRLTSDEFDERSGAALSARTLGDLDGLMTDLPGPARTAPPPAPAPMPTQAPMPPQFDRRLPQVRAVPGVVALVVVAVVALGLGATQGHLAWHIWWIIPIALIVARRLGRRGPGRF